MIWCVLIDIFSADYHTWPRLTFQLNEFEFIDSFPLWLIYVCIPDISLLGLIRETRCSRYGNHSFQMIYSLDFFPCTDGQKRKKSLRRKLDSLAKEKSKDKGTPSSFNTHSDVLPVPRVFSPRLFFLYHDSNMSLSYQWDGGPVGGLRPSGRWTVRL